MNFQKKLDFIVKKNNSLVCIGLDTDLAKIPSEFKQKRYPLFEFNKHIIDATHDLVCCYKPNSAFYEAYGADGILQLKKTFEYMQKKCPDVCTILDFKRGDIGSTNAGYVKFAYEYLGADAVTLHPYLGKEALQPFLERKDKGSIILCKTSNPGGGEFQSLKIKKNVLYKIVAKRVATEWNSNKNCILVVGATYPKELAVVRKIVGEMTILVPGISAQGGDLKKTLKAGLNSKKSGLIIASSRGIIYASQGKNFAEKARAEASKLREEINSYRS